MNRGLEPHVSGVLRADIPRIARNLVYFGELAIEQGAFGPASGQFARVLAEAHQARYYPGELYGSVVQVITECAEPAHLVRWQLAASALELVLKLDGKEAAAPATGAPITGAADERIPFE